ncbi:hypothetical protein HHL17_24515 [Chitinophaga sp. G-6-1-13]|uniref:Uncharacterized protein n=1 Tax=Chitinophaga fulva TaxID=2728842 RepID=A0A848GUH9_9BACT|nr:hypothetical protein [Chitinophaga fulva]NML40383.1 hypothetical protein [Chitinophaga fulva]
MKKTTVKKLSLKMIKIAQLNDNGAQFILGGNVGPTAPTGTTGSPTGAPTGPVTSPTSWSTGPAGPPTTCATGPGTITVACPHG